MGGGILDPTLCVSMIIYFVPMQILELTNVINEATINVQWHYAYHLHLVNRCESFRVCESFYCSSGQSVEEVSQ